mmetsp:Transcript_117572/g.262869  ORF Transcript_117572/g.262869 Transcript_117572/m.262869 type:complete len:253 (-) Transcript_117572:743-1501(-)
MEGGATRQRCLSCEESLQGVQGGHREIGGVRQLVITNAIHCQHRHRPATGGPPAKDIIDAVPDDEHGCRFHAPSFATVEHRRRVGLVGYVGVARHNGINEVEVAFAQAGVAQKGLHASPAVPGEDANVHAPGPQPLHASLEARLKSRRVEGPLLLLFDDSHGRRQCSVIARMELTKERDDVRVWRHTCPFPHPLEIYLFGQGQGAVHVEDHSLQRQRLHQLASERDKWLLDDALALDEPELGRHALPTNSLG